jgi:hypothetical protein
MNPPIETLFRTRIQIGNFNPLQSYETNCPRAECGVTFMLLFPVSILSLVEHRVLDVGCPKCKREFNVLAGDLVASEGTQLTAEVLFIR